MSCDTGDLRQASVASRTGGHTAADLYNTAMARIDELMGVEVGTPESEELRLIVSLVVYYEQPNNMPCPAR